MADRRGIGNRIALISGVFLLAVVMAVAVAWTRFRVVHKGWAWWDPPPVLSVFKRDYGRGSSSPETRADVTSSTHMDWREVGREWPMGWSIWSLEPASGPGPTEVPTIVYLRVRPNAFVAYGLSGGS